jgi:hypothetical protein
MNLAAYRYHGDEGRPVARAFEGELDGGRGVDACDCVFALKGDAIQRRKSRGRFCRLRVGLSPCWQAQANDEE